jgi:flagellar hook-associated protein 1 FlgK
MSDNIMNIGLSGLAAAQWGLTVTGQNISNVNSPGYTLENPVFAESAGQYTGSGFAGEGVTTATVTRAYSSYLNTQMNNATASSGSLSTYFSLMQQLDNLVGSPTSGIATGISGFFSGMQSVSTAEGTTASRQSAMSSAQTLADEMNSAAQTYDQMRESINTQLSSSVTTINSLSSQIATLNSQIAIASAQGQPPNQLLDARDLAVTNLSALVGVQVVDSNGSYNITMGTGQPLVTGSTSYALQTVTSPSDPSELSIAYAPINGATPTPAQTDYLSDSTFTSGSVAGLLQFRDQSLDPAQAQLGAIATSFAAQVNQQNAQGIDGNGQPGGPLFSVAPPTVFSDVRNTGNATLSATITNSTSPPDSNYTLAFDGTNYTITDNATGQQVGQATTLAAAGASIGLTLSATGTMAPGDSFNIQPTRDALDSFGLATQSASAIAAASPVVTSAANSNSGTGAISSATVASGFSIPTNVTMTFNANSTPPSFTSNVPVTLSDGTVVAAGAAIPYDSTTGLTFTTMTGTATDGVTATITGTPGNGDTFDIDKNTSGTGDGSNAAAIANLATAKSMDNGTDTLTTAYSNFIDNIGNVTDQLQTQSTTQTAVLNQVTSQQQSVSGVNLNEEASNLIEYQQLYQANSKVIQTAQTLFQTLIGIFQ